MRSQPLSRLENLRIHLRFSSTLALASITMGTILTLSFVNDIVCLTFTQCVCDISFKGRGK